ncbi:MAG: hypothetical protein ACK5HY_03975 [Parahaliea sp.]
MNPQATTAHSEAVAGNDAAPGAGVPPPDPSPRDQSLLELFQLLADTGADLGQLTLLELRLAAQNLGRMVVLALLFLPLALLIWLGFSLLPALALYQASGSLVQAAAVFLFIQLAALGLLCLLWLRYRRSLRLPRTREQVKALGAGLDRGPAA